MCYIGDWKDYLLEKHNGKIGIFVKTALFIVAIGLFFLIAILDNFRVQILKKKSWIKKAYGFKVDEL